jgi:hypothetical protein
MQIDNAVVAARDADPGSLVVELSVMARGTAQSDPFTLPGAVCHDRPDHPDRQAVGVVPAIGRVGKKPVAGEVLVSTEQLLAVRDLEIEEDVVRHRCRTL